MDQRTGDPRIYIVTLLFLSCILTGGVLLGLYLLQDDPNPLFLEAGMFFVGIPWLFWFLAYLYSCLLKPCIVFCLSKNVSTFDDPEKGKDEEEKNSKSVTEIATSSLDPVAAVEPRGSPRDGEKHVQFGNVVVLGDEEGGKAAEEEKDDRNERSTNKLIPDHMRMGDDDNQEHDMLNSRSDDDDKTPLRLSVGNK